MNFIHEKGLSQRVGQFQSAMVRFECLSSRILKSTEIKDVEIN